MINVHNDTTPLPSGWRWAKLAEVTRVVPGSTPSSHTREFWNGDLVWITPTDLGRLQGSYISDSGRKITRGGYESCGTEMVPVGSVVLSSRAPIGHLGVASVPLCTNQGCKSFVPGEDIDSLFLYFALKGSVPILKALGSGATFTEVSKSQLAAFKIPLPPLAEQKRIAAILNERLAAVESARAGTEAQLEAARALPAAYLREVFSSPEAKMWEKRRLCDVASLLPSKSISTEGDTMVNAITTACLTEAGFESSGIKEARMWSIDAAASKVSCGEVLVARSNTEELVGRVAMYSGEPKDVVASDLTIRLFPKDLIESSFMASYLTYLYLSRYWRKKAGGASGSMKKITRTQIQQIEIPVPHKSEQDRIVSSLEQRILIARSSRLHIESQFDAITKLPGALLRRAFRGEL